jgi:hypothetical protein
VTEKKLGISKEELNKNNEEMMEIERDGKENSLYI